MRPLGVALILAALAATARGQETGSAQPADRPPAREAPLRGAAGSKRPKAAKPVAPAAPEVPPAEIEARVRMLRDPRAEARGEAEEFLERHRRAALTALLPALKAPEAHARLSAVRLLGPVREASVKEALREALGDPDPLVRRQAAMALRGQDPKGLRDLYLETFQAERDPAVRKSLLLSLQALRDEEAVPRLILLLDGEADEYMRDQLRRTLRRLTEGRDLGEDAEAWSEWWYFQRQREREESREKPG